VDVVSNAIIKQQGERSFVADNIWHLRLGPVPFALGLLVGVGAAFALRGPGSEVRTMRPPVPRDWPVGFAHRGGAGIGPEDTLEGFRAGLAAGAGVVELDVHQCRSGELVVIHDPDVERTTDGTGRVSDLTLAELRRLDAAYRFTPDNGVTFPWRGKGVRIPTLDDVYREFTGPINIEIKGERSGIETVLWQAIEAHDATGRTLVSSDSSSTIRRFRRASGGQVPTGASALEILVFLIRYLLRMPQPEPRFEALQAPMRFKGIVPVVTQGFVRSAHDHSVRVDVWTIDDPSAMRRLLGYGVDGIMTDRPDVLSQVLSDA
jgi:glycerophosphoryl diester phosphodiesterase